MTTWWFRLDGDFVEHPKVMDLSDRAFRLHVAGLCYATRNLTDGILADRAVKVVCALTAATRKHVVELRDAGLWVALENGYEIKDYLDYNPDAETLKELRDKRREAGRLGGIRSGESRRSKQQNTEAPGEAKDEASAEANASRFAGGGASNHIDKNKNLEPKTFAAAAPPRKPREPDLVWEAVLEVCGIEQASLTKSGRGAANTAVADIKAAGGTPADVRSRAVEFRRNWPGITLTPSALAKHWAGLRSATAATGDKYARLRGEAA